LRIGVPCARLGSPAIGQAHLFRQQLPPGTPVRTTLGQIDAGAGQRYATLNFTTHGGKSCVLRNDLTGFTFVKSGPEGGARSIRARVTREAVRDPGGHSIRSSGQA
jgi:hypothetical protein